MTPWCLYIENGRIIRARYDNVPRGVRRWPNNAGGRKAANRALRRQEIEKAVDEYRREITSEKDMEN